MKKANILILAGQSNAQGVGHTKYLNNYFSDEQVSVFRSGYEHIKIRYISHDIKNDCFERTRVNCTESSKDTFGPEVGYAKRMNELCPGEEFFIVKCAFGGTSLCGDWRSPSCEEKYHLNSKATECEEIIEVFKKENMIPGWSYNQLVSLMKNSIEELKTMGYETDLCSFAWVQGEADATDTTATENYIYLFNPFLNDFKKEFETYIKEWNIIDVGISDFWKRCERMNQLKQENAEKLDYHYISPQALGLTTKKEPVEEPDLAHYDSESVMKLGEKIADIVYGQIKKSPV